jgi:hypothetical protein
MPDRFASGSRAIPHEKCALSEVQQFVPCLVLGITQRDFAAVGDFGVFGVHAARSESPPRL